MQKKLSEMTLQELWQLFPIYLTAPQPQWATWYAQEVSALQAVIPIPAQYYHIGSTAITGIWAKPIIDILLVVPHRQQQKDVAAILQQNGYICMSESATRISLNKGYTEQGFAKKVFHLHLRLADDIDEIHFRNYLNAHPAVAKEYEQLKLRLWKQYEHDRDGYTQAKTDFVTRYTALAKLM